MNHFKLNIAKALQMYKENGDRRKSTVINEIIEKFGFTRDFVHEIIDNNGIIKRKEYPLYTTDKGVSRLKFNTERECFSNQKDYEEWCDMYDEQKINKPKT